MTESTALTTTTSNNQALAFLHDGAALAVRIKGADIIRQDVLDIAAEMERLSDDQG